ncbi:MAG: lipid-A-disaccharide synthase, partial [Alphaproteobacteria bacterium]
MRAAPQIYLIAGEASGDQLGAWLMAALTQQQAGLRFAGIGGTAMRGITGFTTLFPT